MKTKRFFAVFLCLVMLFNTTSLTVFSTETSQTYTTEYVKVNSVEEIIPNARYIIVGTYTDEITGEVTYHAMGKENRPNDGFRCSYGQDQNGTRHFDISEDKEKITVYSYPTYDPILRVRIRPRDDEGRFYLEVDGKGYLCGYSDSTSDGANGHDLHSCLPIDNYTIGETWWYMRVPTSGDCAGDWQIVNRSRLGNYRGYYYDIIQMGRPYPNSAGQFRAEPVNREDVGELDEDEYIKYTIDKDTNILLYREICTHRSEEVTHKEALEATCDNPGVLEYWYCAGCRKYFSDENMSTGTAIENAVIAPPAHDYDVSGACTVCGATKNTMTFIEYDESSYGSDMDGEMFIFVGFKDGKAYVMGNNTNPDGSREAVEIPVKSNGAITTSSDIAEFFTFEFSVPTGGCSFSPDGGYMSIFGKKIAVYNKSLVKEEGMPEPVRFGDGYFYNWTSDDYIVFDPETLTFKVSDSKTNSIVQYKQVCTHTNIQYVPGTDATCTEQGAVEYWYCDDCYCYFMNNDLEKPVEIYDQSELTKRATSHNFGADGVCTNCGMKRNVYKPITTLEQFDQLSENAYYIIVFKDGDKTYATRVPDTSYPCDADINGNGILDLAEPDNNSNGIPDAVEEYIQTNCLWADVDEDGVITFDEYKEFVGDYDGDEDVDIDDYLMFFEYNVHWEQHMSYEEQAYQSSNFAEVTVADDGTITVVDEGAMEFQMIASGVGGGQPNEDWMLEENGVKDTDRLRAAWIPNYWVANSGTLGYYDEGHFMIQERNYGDREYPGVIDNKNWKISFNVDGTALLVCTWAEYNDTAALQLVKYKGENGDDRMTVVGCYDYLWEDSPIMSNVTSKMPAYLYASEPVYSHVHIWGPWVSDDSSDTHTRRCSAQGCTVLTETLRHTWDNGLQSKAPTCTEPGEMKYTCRDCGAVKVEPIAPTTHVWGDWEINKLDELNTHIRYCSCNESQTEPHVFVDHQCVCGAKDKITVTIMNCDTVITTVEADNVTGVKVEDVPAPEKPKGYVFAGWQTDEGILVEDGMMFVENLVLNPEYFSGDADGDGKIEKDDASTILQYIVGVDKTNVEDQAALDVNKDGKVSVVDSIALLLQIVNQNLFN